MDRRDLIIQANCGVLLEYVKVALSRLDSMLA